MNAKKKTIDLNKYTPTNDHDNADLCIIPMKMVDGTQPPELYFMSNTKRSIVGIDDISNAEWSPTVSIDMFAEPEDYIRLVEWWFASATDQYKKSLVKAFPSIDIPTKIKHLVHWLVTEAAYHQSRNGRFDKRRQKIGAFIINCLTSEESRNKGGKK